MKDSKQFWDNSADKYVARPIKDEATYRKKLSITQSYFRPDSQILEFGCGSGGTAIRHAPYVQSIVAIDISEKMIEIARRKAGDAHVGNVSFQQGTLDASTIKDHSFDGVLGLNVLHLLDNVDDAIGRVHRLLKADGVFITSTSLLGEVNFIFRWLVSTMQFLNLAPFVDRMTRDQLVSRLQNAGFLIEHEWRVSHESVFIVARKQG